VVAGDAEELPALLEELERGVRGPRLPPADCVRASNTEDAAATKSGMAPAAEAAVVLLRRGEGERAVVQSRRGERCGVGECGGGGE
jgi:hypothetical protein